MKSEDQLLRDMRFLLYLLRLAGVVPEDVTGVTFPDEYRKYEERAKLIKFKADEGSDPEGLRAIMAQYREMMCAYGVLPPGSKWTATIDQVKDGLRDFSTRLRKALDSIWTEKDRCKSKANEVASLRAKLRRIEKSFKGLDGLQPTPAEAEHLASYLRFLRARTAKKHKKKTP